MRLARRNALLIGENSSVVPCYILVLITTVPNTGQCLILVGILIVLRTHTHLMRLPSLNFGAARAVCVDCR